MDRNTQLNDDLGLDHFEGRSYRGWAHHVVLTAVAFTFLQLERARAAGAVRPTLSVVRGWVREILRLLYVIHNPSAAANAGKLSTASTATKVTK